MANTKRFLLTLAFTCSVYYIFAQKPVQVSISIAPPYSPYLSSFTGSNASKIILTLQNLTGNSYQVKLAGSFTGDNGVSIKSKPGYMSQHPLILGPHQVKQINGTGLSDLFDVNNLSIAGISQATLERTLRLPEGNYDICVQALDYLNGQPLSDGSPNGCAAISVAYPDVPVLINPMPGDSINSLIPQNIIFTWMNPGSVPIGTQYTLQLAEMPLPNSDPNQVLNAASFPLLNQTVRTTTYVYNISNLALKAGVKYAWRVTATDPMGNTIFKNNGVSGAASFTYKNFTVPQNVAASNINPPAVPYANNIPPKLPLPNNPAANNPVPGGVINTNPGGNLNNPVAPNQVILLKKNMEISGTLNFQYHDAGNAAKLPASFKGIKAEALPLANQAIELYYGTCLVKMNIKTITSNQTVSNAWIQANGIDKNTKVFYKTKDSSIIQTTRIDSIPSFGVPLPPAAYYVDDNIPYINSLPGAKPVATTYTDSAGNYKFFAAAPQKPILTAYTDGTAFINCYYINVKDKHYTDPVQYIYLSYENDTNETSLNTGTFKVFAVNYTLGVVIDRSDIEENAKKSNNFSIEKGNDAAIDVYILRKGGIAGLQGIPKNEGDNIGGYPFKSSYNKNLANSSYNVVSKQTVTVNKDNAVYGKYASAYFNNLMCNVTNQEDYYVYAEYKGDSVFFQPVAHHYSTPSFELQNNYAPVYGSFDQSDVLTLTPSYVSVTVKGILKYTFKDGVAKPLANVKMSLQNIYYQTNISNTREYDFTNKFGLNSTVATTTSVGEGYFQFFAGDLDYNKYKNGDKGSGGWRQFIIVNNVYYGSPDSSYTFEAGNTYNVGEVVARVKDYSLKTINLADKAGSPALQGERVFICRKASINPQDWGVPPDEGTPISVPSKQITDKDGNKYNVAGFGITDNLGYVTFDNLVVNDKNNSADVYYVYSESGITSLDNYSTQYAYATNSSNLYLYEESIWSYFKSLTFNSDFNTKQHTISAIFKATPLSPFIEGSVYPFGNSSTSALAGVKVDLYNVNTILLPSTKFEADVKLYGVQVAINYANLLQTQTTPVDGVFHFDNIDISQSNTWKLLVYSKAGFIAGYNVVNAGANFGTGFKETEKGFLYPPANLTVLVKDAATGSSLQANIVVGDNFSWGTTTGVGQLLGAKLTSPYNAVTFKVIPEDNVHYRTQTFTRQIVNTQANQVLDPFLLDPKENTGTTVTIALLDATNNKAIGGTMSILDIPDANNPAPASKPVLMIANKSTQLVFKASQSYFRVQLTSSGYATKTLTFSNPVSGTVSAIILMQPGLNISGKVTVDGKAVKNAKVYIQQLNPAVEATTDDNGSFTLSGLPQTKQQVTITAADAAANAIGQSFNITLAPDAANASNSGGSGIFQFNGNIGLYGATPSKTVNFSLVTSKIFALGSLYGFPLNVESLNKIGNDYYLTGKIQVPANTTFAIKAAIPSQAYLHFSNLKLKQMRPDGQLTKPEAVNGSVDIDDDGVPITLFTNYDAILDGGSQGITVKPAGGSVDNGIVNGAAGITSSAFASNVLFPGSAYYYLQPEFKGRPTLLLPASPLSPKPDVKVLDGAIPVFVSSVQFLNNNIAPYYSFKTTNGQLLYLLNNLYPATANSASYLANDGGHFFTTLHTSLENVSQPDIALNIGEVVVTDKVLMTVNGTSPIVIPLDTWNIKSSSWTLNNGALHVTGNIEAGSITVPVTGLEISYKSIGFGQMNLDNIKLAGIKSLGVTQANTTISFGYDKGAQYGTLYSPAYGCWSLSLLPKAANGVLTSLSSLPDMKATDAISIMNISLYSKGSESRIILNQMQPAVTLNGFASFTPYTLQNGEGFLIINGYLNMNIPGLTGTENVAYKLKYNADANGILQHQHDAIAGFKLVTNGIKADFGTDGQIFTGGQLVLKGTLTDKAANSPYSFGVGMLVQNINNKPYGAIAINNDTTSIALGGTQKMAVTLGSMGLDANGWSNFKFEGNIAGTEGMAKTHLGFEVKGDLVVNKAHVGIQNMDLGDYGVFSLTYDFEKKSVLGSLQVNNISTPTADFDAGFEMQLGNGSWYLLASANIHRLKILPLPLNGAGAAFCFGNSDITAGMLQIIQPVFHNGELPDKFADTYKHVKGCLFVAAVDMKLPLPAVDIDITVAHVHVGYGIYANAWAMLDFADAPVIHGGMKIGAYINVDGGASIGLACVGVSLGAEVNVQGDLTVSLPSLSSIKLNSASDLFKIPKVGITLSPQVTVMLGGEAYAGAGVCNSNCESVKAWGITIPPGCHKVGIGKTLSVTGGVTITKLPDDLTPSSAIFYVNLFGTPHSTPVNIPHL